MPNPSEILAARLLARRQSQGQSAPADQPSSLSDVVASVGSYGLGVVAAAGNTLDLPGSMVRDIAVGENPFDQILTPFSDKNRTSGRDVLTKYGITRKNKETGISGWLKDPGEGVADLAGFGLEVLLDPFGPIGKVFKIPQAAGVGMKAIGGVGRKFISGTPYIGRAFDVSLDVAERASKMMFSAKVANTYQPEAQKLAEEFTTNYWRIQDDIQAKALAVAGESELAGFSMRTENPDYLDNMAAVVRYVEDVEGFAKQIDPNVKTLPDKLKPHFDALKASMQDLRTKHAKLLNSPGFVDQAGIDYFPRRMLDELKAGITDEEGIGGVQIGSRGFTTVDGGTSYRDHIVKGFHEGTMGVQKLLKDPKWTEKINEIRADMDKVLMPGSPIARGVGLAGPRHLKLFAEAVDVSEDDLWKMLQFDPAKPYAPYIEVRNRLEVFKNSVNSLVKSGQLPSVKTQMVHGRGGWLYDNLVTGKGAALRMDKNGTVLNLRGQQPIERAGDIEWDKLVADLTVKQRAAAANPLMVKWYQSALDRIADARRAGMKGFYEWKNIKGETGFYIPRTKTAIEAGWTKKVKSFARKVTDKPVGEEEAAQGAIKHMISQEYKDQVIREMPHVDKDGKFVFEEQIGGMPTGLRRRYTPAETQNPAIQQKIAQLGLVQKMDDRYESLADLIVRREKVREFGMFGNNPIVDWADAAIGMARRTETAETLLKLVEDTFVERWENPKNISRMTQRVTPTGFKGDGGLPVKDMLSRQSTINEVKFLNHLALNLRKKGFAGFDYAPMKKDTKLGRLYNDTFRKVVLEHTKLDPKVIGELSAMFEYFDKPPEMKGWERIIDSYMSVHKSGLLSTPATVMRDALSAMTNGLIRGDMEMSPSGIRRIKDGFSLARGRAASSIDFPEVRQMAQSIGLDPNNADDRARAFVYMFTGASNKSHMHAQLVNADFDSVAKSGQIDSLLDALPNSRRESAGEALKRMWSSQPWWDQANPINTPGVWKWQSETVPKGSKETLRDMLKRTTNPAKWDKGKWVVNDTTNIVAGVHGAVRGVVDNGIRMSSVLTQMDRGVPFLEAFRRTAASQINYDPRTYTRFEKRYMKKLFPFYSFISRSLPMVAMELVTNPGGGMGQLIRAQRLAQGGQDDYVPYDLQDTSAIPLGENEAGDLVYIRNLGLMHEDAMQYLAPTQGVRGILQKVIGSSNPLIKATLEYGMNTSTFFDGPMGGRRLDDLDPAVGRILNNMGITQLPPSGRPTPVFGSTLFENMAANSPAAAAIRYARILTEPTTRTSIPDKAFNLLTGMKTKHITREALIRELRDRLNAEQIDLGARPITIVTGTEGLQEAYAESGQVDRAQRLKIISEQLSALRKEIKRSTEKK